MTRQSHFIRANGLKHHVLECNPESISRGTIMLLHGFPDDHTIWTELTPLLIDANYRVVAPDMRGFGESEMPQMTSDYEFMRGPVQDVVGILEKLECGKVHLVGHDLGAGVAWILAGQYPERFHSLTSLSVGHHRSFLRMAKKPEQRTRSMYILFHQFVGLCEWYYSRKDWALFRKLWAAHSDLNAAISKLSRPGRLKAGLSWYRANLSIGRMLRSPKVGAFGNETIRVPTLGIWSSGDTYLTEAQVTGSEDFVEAQWRYEKLDSYSHWFPVEAPKELAQLLLDHWQKHEPLDGSMSVSLKSTDANTAKSY